jgi:hypothetical protein
MSKIMIRFVADGLDTLYIEELEDYGVRDYKLTDNPEHGHEFQPHEAYEVLKNLLAAEITGEPLWKFDTFQLLKLQVTTLEALPYEAESGGMKGILLPTLAEPVHVELVDEDSSIIARHAIDPEEVIDLDLDPELLEEPKVETIIEKFKRGEYTEIYPIRVGKLLLTDLMQAMQLKAPITAFAAVAFRLGDEAMITRIEPQEEGYTGTATLQSTNSPSLFEERWMGQQIGKPCTLDEAKSFILAGSDDKVFERFTTWYKENNPE